MTTINETILGNSPDQAPEIRSTTAVEDSETILDAATFRAIEVDRLFDTINHAQTTIGQAMLFRSLTRPLDNLEAIEAKQAALRELQSNTQLKQSIEAMVDNASQDENRFYQLLYCEFLGFFGNPRHDQEQEGYGYAQYTKGTRLMLELSQNAHQLPDPESNYLKQQIQVLRDFANSRAYALMKGPVYCTESGMKTQAEKNSWIPSIRFTPTLIKPLFITGLIVMFIILAQFNPFAAMGISMDTSIAPMLTILMLPAFLLYTPIIGGFDRDACIYPLRKEFKASEAVHETLEALGKLDELLSFNRYAEESVHTLILPKMVDSEHHSVRLSAARNPILAKQDADYVGNDIVLADNPLTFITGPNSGGKTAFCKTLTQIQLLSQIGCGIPAESAELSVADHIFYQVPEVSHLQSDGEGRFGTELKRTKNIFLNTTPKSLVVLDELSEGTTYEEKLETSVTILESFYKIGNNTLLISHNHELVETFQKKGIGLCRQVEFVGDEPSYKLIEGISRVSHADRVARKIGFSKQDMDEHLDKKGWSQK